MKLFTLCDSVVYSSEYVTPSVALSSVISGDHDVSLGYSFDGEQFNLLVHSDPANKISNIRFKDGIEVSRSSITTSDEFTVLQQDVSSGVIYALKASLKTYGVSGFYKPCSVYAMTTDCNDLRKVVLRAAGTEFVPIFALDMKIDSASALLWVSSAYDANISAFSLTTYDLVYQVKTPIIELPSTLCVDISTGNVFVRCHNQATGKEAIAKIVRDQIAYMFELPSGPLSQTITYQYQSGAYPFMRSNTMRYDHIRKSLVFVSEDNNTLYCINESGA